MTRLPIPGQDENSWGDLLNDFLTQEFINDGSSHSGQLKIRYDGVLGTPNDASVTNAKVASNAAIDQSKINNLTSDLATKADDAAVVHKSLIAGKGELLAGSGMAAVTNVSAGTDGQVLIADAAQAAGLRWGSAPGGSLAAASDATLTGPLKTGHNLVYSEATSKWVNRFGPVLNVKDFGAKGDGTTDDAAAIQACITASPYGGTIYFPYGTYAVGATVKLLKARRYMGSTRENSVIKMMNGANLDAVVATETWLSTTSLASDNPIHVSELGIDGNKANQTAGLGVGLAMISFWNHIEKLTIKNTRGDGLLLTSKRQDGGEITSGSAGVENHISQVDVRAAGGHGFHVEDPTPATQNVTDGWIVDCVVESPGLDGIRIESSAGWLVQGCHLYGCTRNGMLIGRAAYTRIINNYIEPWGSTATAGTWVAIALGDGVSAFSVGQVVVMGNVIYMGSQQGGTTIYGMSTVTSNGSTSHFTIVGNTFLGNGFNTAIRLSNQGSTANTYARLSANSLMSWATRISTAAASGVMSISGDTFPQTLANNATLGFSRLPSVAGTPTGTPADLTEGTPMVVDTTNNQMYAYYGSAWNVVGSGAAAANPASITSIRSVAVESGSYMVTAMGGTGTSNTWTLGLIYLAPIDVPTSTGATGLGTNLNIQAVGGTSPLVHLGLYNDIGNGSRPSGALISGSEVTFDPTTTATGNVYGAWASASTLAPGRYWIGLGITSTTAFSTAPTLITLNPLQNIGLASLGNNSHRGWGYSAGNFSTMPTLGTLTRTGGNWPIMGIRVQ